MKAGVESKQEYEFYAFLSYKRGDDDEKWARSLQRRLESYRIPVADLNEKLTDKRLPIPKRIKVFRDKTDLGSHSNLHQGLSMSLDSSRYLIVICSPRSAASPYVDDEVRYFVETGRGENIVPFVVRGATDFCCPPSLPLNIERVESSGTDEEAFIRLLARLLQVDYKKLYQTHLKASRRRAIWMLSCVTAAFTMTAGLALWAVSAERRATTYRVESEALVDFLTFDLISQAAHYIPTHARASITDRVREYYERWEPSEPKAVYARAINLAQRGGVIADHTPRGALELQLMSSGLLEKLHQNLPDNENYSVTYSDTLLSIGNIHEVLGEPEAAISRYLEALNVARAFSKKFPEILRGREQVAAALKNLAEAARTLGMLKAGNAYYSECAQIWEEMLRQWPEGMRTWLYRMRLGNFYSGYGNFEVLQNNFATALTHVGNAVEIFEHFYEEDPKNIAVRVFFANELNMATFLLIKFGEFEIADKLFTKGEELWRSLVAEDPLLGYVLGWADMLINGALLRIEQGVDASELLAEAEELVDDTLSLQPKNEAFLSKKLLIKEYRDRMRERILE